MNKLDHDAIMRAANLMCSDAPPWSPSIAEKVGRLLAVEADCPHEHTVAIQLAYAIVDVEKVPGAPLVPAPDPCGAYSRWHRLGGTLGPCIKPAGHVDPGRPDADWHSDATGSAWGPAADATAPTGATS